MYFVFHCAFVRSKFDLINVKNLEKIVNTDWNVTMAITLTEKPEKMLKNVKKKRAIEILTQRKDTK